MREKDGNKKVMPGERWVGGNKEEEEEVAAGMTGEDKSV